MYFSIFNILRQLLGCLFLLACLSCNRAKTITPKLATNPSVKLENNIALSKLITLVKTGDIITRTGNDFTSQSLKTLNRKDKTFSHCGIASIENDSLFVYHAIGGEYNPNQCITKDYILNYAMPNYNNAIGVYRFALNTTQLNALLKQAKYYFNKKIVFDMDFNLASNNKMYCTEYVFKCFYYGVPSLPYFNISQIGTKKFIGVDDILLHPLCVPIIIHFYKF